MSLPRHFWSSLAGVGLALVLVPGVLYAPSLTYGADGSRLPGPSIIDQLQHTDLAAAPGITDQLQRAGLVDGATIDASSVLKLLADIPSATSLTLSGYDRDTFGPAWADTDHNGCDQRNDVLARDLTGVRYKPGTHDCVVLTGTLADPYTGATIHFTRGSTTSTAVQVDHMVPLSWAYQHGASTWTEQRREQLATDLSNLTAVDGPSNGSKSDQGPATWMPPSTTYACTYVTRFTYVVHRYELTLDTADRAAITRTLQNCK